MARELAVCIQKEVALIESIETYLSQSETLSYDAQAAIYRGIDSWVRYDQFAYALGHTEMTLNNSIDQSIKSYLP